MESLSGRAQHLSLRSGQSRGRRHAWKEARMPRSRHVSTRDTPGTGEGLSRQSKAPGRPCKLCALKRSDVQQRPSQNSNVQPSAFAVVSETLQLIIVFVIKLLIAFQQ